MSNAPERATLGQKSDLRELVPAIQGLVLDLDGVLWKEATPIGDLRAVFQRIASIQLGVVAATNNATKTVEQYLERLRGFGVVLEPRQIITSAEAAANTLARQCPEKGRVFVVGEDGVVRALREEGFEVIVDPHDQREVVAVVAGLDREFTYSRLECASAHVRRGALFVGTNPDPTFPTPAGLVPGAGSILSAIATASETAPMVIGKPSPFMFELAAQRLNLPKERILIVGDRLETDIAGGQGFGARTALVLSGVSSRAQADAWRPPPDLIAADLSELVGA